ncbi:uncharacterized protein LOC130805581 [Amaranthus tricolor]|uniref:uncharacterized protein LOC130805581 n=1 Tax=Amaranthus tricolor TaxID=29722 RepID=UPI00258B543F|nr:uncharacterized protein LOC130805581 [Amaranthus tricolor]
MDFVLGFPRTRAGNDTLWVIVDRLTKSAKFIPMNCKWDMEQLARAYIKDVIRPDMLVQMTEQVKLIREKIKAAQDRQKSYADLRRRPNEFEVGDKVLLCVSLIKGVVRFGARGKLSPCFIGPYDIVEKVGKLAYRLALPNALELDESLTYEEQLVRILDAKVHSTRRKDITMVKVLWSNHRSQEATWETEYSMREQYPHFFSQVSKLRGRNFDKGGGRR